MLTTWKANHNLAPGRWQSAGQAPRKISLRRTLLFNLNYAFDEIISDAIKLQSPNPDNITSICRWGDGGDSGSECDSWADGSCNMCSGMLDSSRDRIPFWLWQLSHRISISLLLPRTHHSPLKSTKQNVYVSKGNSGKSGKKEWKRRLAGSRLETSKFGGTHISVWIKFAYALEKSGSIDSKSLLSSSSLDSFLLFLFALLRCCWLCGCGSIWLLEFKLIAGSGQVYTLRELVNYFRGKDFGKYNFF